MGYITVKRNQAYRVFTGKNTTTHQNIYDKVSFWKDASDIVFDDNKTLESYMDYASGMLNYDESDLDIYDSKIKAGAMVDVYVPDEYHKCCPISMEVEEGHVHLLFPEPKLRKPAYGAGNGAMEVRVVCHDGAVASDSGTDPVGPIKIVGWDTGTDEEICDMVLAAWADQIDLDDYWAIGNERRVNFVYSNGRDSQSDYVDPDDFMVDNYYRVTCHFDSHSEDYPITLVLMDGAKFQVPGDEGAVLCNFVVGVKEALTASPDITMLEAYPQDMRSGEFFDYYTGWKFSQPRFWCNHSFPKGLPSSLRSIFKMFYCKTMEIESLEEKSDPPPIPHDTVNYFALFAEKEVYGSCTYSYDTEDELEQIEYYKTVANRVKTETYDAEHGVTPPSEGKRWWLRSPIDPVKAGNHEGYYCFVKPDGAVNGQAYSSANQYMSPFGVI